MTKVGTAGILCSTSSCSQCLLKSGILELLGLERELLPIETPAPEAATPASLLFGYSRSYGFLCCLGEDLASLGE